MAKKKENFEKIEPPISVEVVQNTTGKRQSLSFLNRYRNNYEAIWPGAGRVAFDMRTGQGYNEVARWHIPAEGLQALRGDPKFKPLDPIMTPGGSRSTVRKTTSDQVAISFDSSAAVTLTPLVVMAPTPAAALVPAFSIAPPARSPRPSAGAPPIDLVAQSAFRAAAHRHFLTYQPPPSREEE